MAAKPLSWEWPLALDLGSWIGVGIYFIHRSHTSLSGCVRQTDHGLSMITKDGNI
jgi:hypothetical protein